MNLIKDGKIAPTGWQFIDAAEHISANAVVSVEFFTSIKLEQLDGSNLGVIIDGDDQLDNLIPHLSKIDLIVIEFSLFSDGRGFSTAYRLRHSIGFQGEIWAKGNLIADQYSQALQCGIDAVLIDDLQLRRQPVEQWQKALEDAPIPYRFENHMGHAYHESKKNLFT